MISTELSNSSQLDSCVPMLTHTSFPSTTQLLSQGGDARIALVGELAINKYGCTPFPDNSLIAFGSSTASIISDVAFAAADSLRDRLLLAVDDALPEVIYTHELNRIRRELLTLCELDDIANLEVVFGASGTDLHLIAAQLASGINTMPTLVIMPDTMETGSGVSMALASSHFSSCSALGGDVTEGAAIEKATVVDVVSVPMRFAGSNLRPASVIDTEVEALVDQAAKIGQHVLLILVDTSKTGLISPSPSCAIQLKQRHPHLVDILVDACQFRISTSTLRAYLEYDFMVIVTGSKFLTGPVFSGALLVPGLVATRLLSHPISLGLRAYSSRAEWPNNYAASEPLDNVENFGLLLRWEAALEELRQFKSVPDRQIASFTQRFAKDILNRLNRDAHFAYIPARQLDRYPLVKKENWDDVPTIFSFVLFRDGDDGKKQPLSHQETLKIYQWLQLASFDPERPDINTLDARAEAVRCQLGQPVFCGSHNGKPVSALRLCLSARLIVEATVNSGKNAAEVIQKALFVLDNVGLLIRLLP